MEYKVVKIHTDLVCKSSDYLFLKEVFNKTKNVIFQKSRATPPCNNYVSVWEYTPLKRRLLYNEIMNSGNSPLINTDSVLSE